MPINGMNDKTARVTGDFTWKYGYLSTGKYFIILVIGIFSLVTPSPGYWIWLASCTTLAILGDVVNSVQLGISPYPHTHPFPWALLFCNTTHVIILIFQ